MIIKEAMIFASSKMVPIGHGKHLNLGYFFDIFHSFLLLPVHLFSIFFSEIFEYFMNDLPHLSCFGC